MAIPQKVVPYKGVDYDVNESNVEAEFKAVFLKNITNSSNDNPRSSIQEGSNAFSFTPIESNQKYCNIQLPAGENYCCGAKYFPDVNQGFVCVWNSNNDHFIYRLNGDTGNCQIVYKNPCLNFQLNPINFIGRTRMALETTCRFNKKTQKEEKVIYLIITDDYNHQRMICVEDSIATNSFDPVMFPYFQVTDDTCEPCSYINLGLAQNLTCIKIETIARDFTNPAEILKKNTTVFKMWQWRIKYIDVWKKGSEHGIISEPYISSIGGACVSGSDGLPRCLKITFPAGCPIVDKIQIEFRNCNGNIAGLSVESDWFLYDTIDKYDNCQNLNWWERPLNTDPDRGFTYDASDNTISYIFCADKGCQPLPVEETNRNENFLPLTSGGVFSINKSIGLFKNTRKFEPLSCDELTKLNFTVEPPSPSANCLNTKLVHVSIYAVIWNPFEGYSIPIRKGNSSPIFGAARCVRNNPETYGQFFPKDQPGFPGYLAGTDYKCISKQYRYDLITGQELFIGDESTSFNTANGIGRYKPLQKFEFDVLPGRYIFRIGSHQNTLSDDYSKTSTYTIGRTALSNLGQLITETKEIVIDVCNGQELKIVSDPMMIYDLTRIGNGCAVVDATSVNAGYIYEDQVETRPIELARVVPNVSSAIRSNYTDHNGFYFSATRQRGLQTTIRGKKNCATNSELAKSQISYDNSTAWYRFDRLSVYKGTVKYPSIDRVIITGKIALCSDVNIGINGSLVVLTNGAYATTNNQGFFKIIAHDIGDMDQRNDDVIYSVKGACTLLTCTGGCVYCFPNYPVTIGTCNGIDRVITVPTLQARINGYNKKGPTMGGRYAVGIILHDLIGRQTFVQSQDKHFIDIPSLQQTQVFDYSRILFNITGIVFPSFVRRITFAITENLIQDDYLTWITEKVEFIDNTGNINNTAPTKIRLYYQSLNEYNKQNDFSTNSVWDIIADKQNGQVVTGDQIEFLANGDGVIYNTKISQLVTYDKIGKFVTVAYTDELKTLKDGALIRLVRPKNCENIQFFYELCPSIKVKNGTPQIVTGELKFFDSYLLNRQIPVPVTTGTTTVNELRNFPFQFEHHSPSDFWGDHCWSKGRVSVKNELETKQCRKTEICVGKALTLDNLFNGLNYFTEKDSIVLDEQEWSSITACFSNISSVLVICEYKSFMIPFNDNLIRSNEQGQVFAGTVSDGFGRPQKISGGDYGVQVEDINTLSINKDIIIGLDSNNGDLVRFTFGKAEGVSANAIKSYLTSNIKAIIKNNSVVDNRKIYFHGCIDPKTMNYHLSIAKIKQAAVDFGNDRDTLTSGLNDTQVYNVLTGAYMGSRSFTPEFYMDMLGDINDQQLISFQFGQAWLHNKLNNNSATFNNFYGVQYTSVFEFVFNLDNSKEKHFMWLETYCKEILFYADRVITSTGQESRIMPNWWEKRGKFWAADFKCAVNTVTDNNLPNQTGINALLDGDSLYGTWVRVRLKPKDMDRSKYFEFISILCFLNSFEKSGT